MIKKNNEYKDILSIHRKISSYLLSDESKSSFSDNDISCQSLGSQGQLFLDNKYIYAEYIAATNNIIEKYNEFIKIPIKKSIIKKNNSPSDNELYNISLEYIKIVKNLNFNNDYIKRLIDTFEKSHSSFSIKKSSKDFLICSNCHNIVNSNHINDFFCHFCGILCDNLVNEYTNDNIGINDKERVNMNQKFVYTHKTHFLETLDQISGKQNKTIPQQVFIDLEQKFHEHHFIKNDKGFYPNLTKEHIHIFLSESGNSRSYEDENYLFKYYTGTSLPDFSNIKSKLLEDFEKVVYGFTILKKMDNNLKRRSFLNINYIIVQLLKKNNFNINIEPFIRPLKTFDRQQEHSTLYSRIAEIISFPAPT